MPSLLRIEVLYSLTKDLQQNLRAVNSACAIYCLICSISWVPSLESTNALESGMIINQWCQFEVLEHKQFTWSVRLVVESLLLLCRNKLILIPAMTNKVSYFSCSNVKYITTPNIFEFSVICCLVLFMNISFLLHWTEWLIQICSHFKKHPRREL